MQMLVVIFLCILFRNLSNGRSQRPTKVALYTLLSDLCWKHFFKIHSTIIFEHYVKDFESFLSLPHLAHNLAKLSDTGG